MHLPSNHNYQEMLASPLFVRLTMAEGDNGREPTLLVKALTLHLKYCVSQEEIELITISLPGGEILYGLQVKDDPEKPATLWSVLETEEEREALKRTANQENLKVFLFNEACVNPAWSEFKIKSRNDWALEKTETTKLKKIDYDQITPTATDYINKFLEGHTDQPDGVWCTAQALSPWMPISAHYITNQLYSSTLHLFPESNQCEGDQQEQLAVWLTDSLSSGGVYKAPIAEEESKPRELCDILINYEHSPILIESKCSSALFENNLPSREKLTKRTTKAIKNRAIRQLKGGINNIRRGVDITDQSGEKISINKRSPAHLIVLIPDLSLLEGQKEFGGKLLKEVTRESGALFQILDPTALLRLMQGANMIHEQSADENITPLVAFDYLLSERFKAATEREDANFDVLIR